MALKGARFSNFGGEEELCARQEMNTTTHEVVEQKTQGFWRREGIMPMYASNQKKRGKESTKMELVQVGKQE